MSSFLAIFAMVLRSLAIAAAIVKAQETLIEGGLSASVWIATSAVLGIFLVLDVGVWKRQRRLRQARQCAWPMCQHPSSHHDEWGCAICVCGQYRRSLND